MINKIGTPIKITADKSTDDIKPEDRDSVRPRTDEIKPEDREKTVDKSENR